MEMMDGYKQTEVGVIPSHWEVKKIEDVAPLQRGFDLPSSMLNEGIYPVVYSNGILARHNEFKAKAPGVVTGRSGTIGKVTFVEENYFPHNTALWVTDFKGNNPKFIYYLYISLKLERFGAGSGVPTLNRNNVHSHKIPVPPLAEQKKIAAILATWDTAIATTEKLIAAQRTRKRALMQRLLTGKLRFPEFVSQAWEKMQISDFAKLTSRPKPKPSKPFLALGIRSHGKGTFLKPDFEPSKIEMTELYEVKENDLIVNITFAWEGAIAIVRKNDAGALVSHRFPTYEFDRELALPEFFRHVIVQRWFVERLGLISPGGAGRNRVLSKKDFGKLEVIMPSVEEQRQIAGILNACDKEIELLEKQRDALKEQKRGLMQRLLTGQVRVKV